MHAGWWRVVFAGIVHDQVYARDGEEELCLAFGVVVAEELRLANVGHVAHQAHVGGDAHRTRRQRRRCPTMLSTGHRRSVRGRVMEWQQVPGKVHYHTACRLTSRIGVVPFLHTGGTLHAANASTSSRGAIGSVVVMGPDGGVPFGRPRPRPLVVPLRSWCATSTTAASSSTVPALARPEGVGGPSAAVAAAGNTSVLSRGRRRRCNCTATKDRRSTVHIGVHALRVQTLFELPKSLRGLPLQPGRRLVAWRVPTRRRHVRRIGSGAPVLRREGMIRPGRGGCLEWWRRRLRRWRWSWWATPSSRIVVIVTAVVALERVDG